MKSLDAEISNSVLTLPLPFKNHSSLLDSCVPFPRSSSSASHSGKRERERETSLLALRIILPLKEKNGQSEIGWQLQNPPQRHL